MSGSRHGFLGETQPIWVSGGGAGISVWAAGGDHRVQASLLVDDATIGPVVLLNREILGTEHEGNALTWALALVAAGTPGFYVLHAAPP